MQPNTSNLRIYGPGLPDAIECLNALAADINKKGDLPITSGETRIGKYDFTFYWKEEPYPAPLMELIQRIDNCLCEKELPARYSITTETYRTNRTVAEIDRKAMNTIFSFIRIHGPRIIEAIRAIEKVIDKIETTNTLDSLRSSLLIGNKDFAFEWDHWPTIEEIHIVLNAIDKEIESTGALYTITTKRNIYRDEKYIDDPSSDNLMAFL